VAAIRAQDDPYLENGLSKMKNRGILILGLVLLCTLPVLDTLLDENTSHRTVRLETPFSQTQNN
jgi:hypothetical protein